jgi:hypothetical protein
MNDSGYYDCSQVFSGEREFVFYSVDVTIQALLAGLPPSNTHTHEYSSGMDARARAGMQKMTYIFGPDSFPSVVFIHSFTIPSFTQPTLARGVAKRSVVCRMASILVCLLRMVMRVGGTVPYLHMIHT